VADNRFENEIKHLNRLKNTLEKDKILTIRFELIRLSLDFRSFRIKISGVNSLIRKPNLSTNYLSNNFSTIWRIPSGYPWSAIPDIQFEQPIPFHPHVFLSGKICWGTLSISQPDMSLSDWLRSVIEYLTYNQNSLVGINIYSPANGDATKWWQFNNNNIPKFIKQIDMNRFRFWIDHTRG